MFSEDLVQYSMKSGVDLVKEHQKVKELTDLCRLPTDLRKDTAVLLPLCLRVLSSMKGKSIGGDHGKTLPCFTFSPEVRL